MAAAVEAYGKPGDVVVLISPSGKSPNIAKAARSAQKLGMKVVTFSGFEKNRQLSKVGDINLWTDSRAYNIIEAVHGIWIFAVVDLIVGSAEYGVSA